MTPEGKVKDHVKKALKSLGYTWSMPVTRGFGTSGVPDFIVNAKGRYMVIETKANGCEASPLQKLFIDKKCCAVGGKALVVGSNALRVVRAFETHDSTPFVFTDVSQDHMPALLRQHIGQNTSQWSAV